MRFATNVLIFLATFAASARAFALEDHIVLQGSFTWILQNDDGSIDSGAKQHFIPAIKIDRQADGTFRIDLTMPPTLSGGVEVKSTYLQKPTSEEGVVYFERAVPVGQSKDYMHCFADADQSWVGVHCDELTLHGLNQIPLAQRMAYEKQHYSGTALDAGMSQGVNAISGAQPAGTANFNSAENGDLKPWLGTWTVTYSTPNGQSVRTQMFIDGFSGAYGSGASRGVLRNIFVTDSNIQGDWQLGNARGFVSFDLSSPTRFTGTWHSDDGTQSGTWNGTLQQH